MKRLAIIALVLLPIACASRQPGTTKSTSTPGRGAIKLTITPNPVVAMSVGGFTYEFPFDAVIKETGGHPVTIERVTANVFAAGGIPVATESFDAAKIQSLGFATTVPAKGEIHYHFAPREALARPRPRPSRSTSWEASGPFHRIATMTDDNLKQLMEANAARIDGAIEGKTNAIEQRMDVGFADTQAMIKFSHAELDRRVRYMEQTLQTLEDRFVGLQTRVDRLEEATKIEN